MIFCKVSVCILNTNDTKRTRHHRMNQATYQSGGTTNVSFEMADGATGTASVPTGCSPADEVIALMTHLHSAFGWIQDDIVVEMIEQGKYMVLIYPAWMRFIQEVCSVEKATTEADKTTVQKELRKYIKLQQIQVLDLKKIYAHYGITTIGDNAFDGCTSLTTIAIPDSVTTIGIAAFAGCSSLTTIAIPDSVTTIGIAAFDGCTSLTAVAIPDSVTAIGMKAFDGCTSLTTVAIPDSVTTIGTFAFAGCTSLTTVAIPDSVTAIRAYAFTECTSLTTVTIPDSVTAIGTDAFALCRSLTTVVIPDSVTTIGRYAFYGCISLVGHGKC